MIADPAAYLRGDALIDRNLINSRRVRGASSHHPSPVDHRAKLRVPFRDDRQIRCARVLHIHPARDPETRHLRYLPERAQLRGRGTGDLQLDRRCTARRVEPRQRRTSTARTSSRREHDRAHDPDQQHEHDDTAPTTPEFRSGQLPNRAHVTYLFAARARARIIGQVADTIASPTTTRIRPRHTRRPQGGQAPRSQGW